MARFVHLALPFSMPVFGRRVVFAARSFGVFTVVCAALVVVAVRAGATEPPATTAPSTVPGSAAPSEAGFGASSSVLHLEPLAASGNRVAQFNLGVLYDVGRGVPQDFARAATWYRFAAKQGHAAAQFNLGGLYFEGQGVPRDPVRASLWFTLAAIAGYDGAARNRNSVATLLSAAQIANVQAMARACLKDNYLGCD